MNSGAIITAREGLGLSQRASRRLLRHTHASSQPVRGISTRRGKGREGKHDACVFVLDAAQRDRRRVMLTRRHKKQAQKTSTNTDTHTDTHTDTNTDTPYTRSASCSQDPPLFVTVSHKTNHFNLPGHLFFVLHLCHESHASLCLDALIAELVGALDILLVKLSHLRALPTLSPVLSEDESCQRLHERIEVRKAGGRG